MYNPEELKLEQGNKFAEVGIPGLDSPAGAVRPREGADAGDGALLRHLRTSAADVRAFTAPVVQLLDKDPQTLAPPILLFSLGRFQFQCVLVDAAQRYTMFLRDGTPVRSTLSVSCRSTSGWTCRSRQGLFFGSPTVSAAVNAAVPRGPAGSSTTTCTWSAPGIPSAAWPPRTWAIPRCGGRSPRPTGSIDPLRHRRSGGRWSSRRAGPGSAMTEPFYAPRFEIRISGVTMAADVADQVLSLTVETDLDLAGSFSLILRNPDNVLLDSPLHRPGQDRGNPPRLRGRGASRRSSARSPSIQPSFPKNSPPTIMVSGYDKSYRMRRSQPEPTEYKFMPDSLIAAQIAVENGLIPVVDPTPGPLAKKVTQTVSDMAFLKTRAQRYFFDVYVEWDRLHFQFPRPQTAAYVLEWGRNLSSFEPRISAAGLAGLQMIRGYNQELAQTDRGRRPRRRRGSGQPAGAAGQLGRGPADVAGAVGDPSSIPWTTR